MITQNLNKIDSLDYRKRVEDDFDKFRPMTSEEVKGFKEVYQEFRKEEEIRNKKREFRKKRKNLFNSFRNEINNKDTDEYYNSVEETSRILEMFNPEECKKLSLHLGYDILGSYYDPSLLSEKHRTFRALYRYRCGDSDLPNILVQEKLADHFLLELDKKSRENYALEYFRMYRNQHSKL